MFLFIIFFLANSFFSSIAVTEKSNKKDFWILPIRFIFRVRGPRIQYLFFICSRKFSPLFSDKQRMVKAIKSLIYNPQNNFRIFRNGVFIYGEQVSIDVFYDVIKEMLYSDDKMSTYR